MGSLVNYLQSTMLIERLVGVGVYVLTLGYFYNKIQHAKSTRAIFRYFNHYLVVLSVMAFFYIPGKTADLFRWRELAEPWKNASFSWFITNRFLKSSTPLGYLLIYICQITGINGLLPAICAFGFYENLFHVFKCETVRENRDADSIAVTLLYVMSSGYFLEVISGVRCMLAFSIVLRCIYDEMYRQKSLLWSIPFFIIAALLHNAAMPLIGVRLVCLLFEKKKSAIMTAINIIAAIATCLVAIRLGNDYIEAAFAKANSYTSNNIYSYSWEYIIAILGLFILITILMKYRNRYPEAWLNEKISVRYLIIILLGELFFIRSYTFFHRFFIVSVIVSVPIIISFLNCENLNGYRISRQKIVIMSVLILLIACTRGNLCGYKFFLLS